MSSLRVAGSDLVVDVSGFLGRAMAMGREVVVPASTARSVRLGSPDLFKFGSWARVFGASFINRHVGYYWGRGIGRVFVDVHHLKQSDLIVEVDCSTESSSKSLISVMNTPVQRLFVETTNEAASACVERLRQELGMVTR